MFKKKEYLKKNNLVSNPFESKFFSFPRKWVILGTYIPLIKFYAPKT